MPPHNRASWVLLAAVVGTGCAQTVTAGPLDVDLSVDAITDVNATSTTFEQPVHPNDYQGMVSAWYFGHAT